MTDLYLIAAKIGCYDAADWLWKNALRRGGATNLEAQTPLPASVSATLEGSQRGRSEA